jgi:hypothetical protein
VKQTWLALALLLALLRVPAPASAAVTIPFQFVDNRVVLALTLDGKGPFSFVLDSGASFTASPQTVAALHLSPHGSFWLGGTGAGQQRASRVRIASVTLGPVTMKDQDFTVVDLDDIHKASALPAFDGLIGSELFARYVVRVDYRARTLTLTDPARFAYSGAGTVVPIVLRDGVPRVAATLDGIAGTFTVDLGDRMDVTFMEPVIERDQLIARYSPRVETITGWGIGGSVPGYVARAQDLQVGALDVKAPLLRLPTVAGGFFTSRWLTGSIGTGVADRFTVTLDYAHKRLIFEDPAPEQRNAYDRSGLWLNQGSDAFDVAAVAPESPAAAAGLTSGDRVVAVNGVPAGKIMLADVRTWLRAEPGTRVTLTVERDGVRSDLRVTLQDLV